MLNLFCTSAHVFSRKVFHDVLVDLSQVFFSPCALAVDRLVVVVALQNLSNEEQVVVIHARTVLTLAEKVRDLPQPFHLVRFGKSDCSVPEKETRKSVKPETLLWPYAERELT